MKLFSLTVTLALHRPVSPGQTRTKILLDTDSVPISMTLGRWRLSRSVLNSILSR